MSETLAGEVAGSQIGRYRLLEQVGEGGMGTIWLAEQREPVKRRVALKIIKLGMDTKEVIARFEAERQALAIMDDPHIAKVFDAGVTETGRPFFVMEYIKGIPILEYCDRERLDTRARLGLFINVCQAIQHAHQKGIIHRDIKPSNVLVTVNDGAPVPKVIDFGVAKATHSELTAKTLFTEHGRMIGTPAYMSPEQAAFTGLDIDTRSDVYSLGVLLYELLTGTTPFDMEDLLSKGYGEMMRAICEDEPHKPSTRISSLGDTGTRTAQQRRADPKRLGSLLQGDIDWIVMKCLEKDRTRRYETANGLAADIRRHLSDEPVTAGAPSAAYKLRKFVKRNRIQVIAGSVALAALLAAIVGTSWGLVQTSRARSADLQRELEDQRRTAADDARLARNAEAVTALLDQGEEALRTGDAAKAKVALEAARKRLAEGGAEKDSARLARLTADLDLLTELDAIDQLRWTWADNRFVDRKVVATRAREALRRFGADPDAVSVEDASQRVDESTIRERIVSAMDRRLQEGQAEAVRAVLRRVDADPYRDAVRDAVLARDGVTLAELGGRAAALEQPPGFAAVLGEIEKIDVGRRVELLQAAVIRRPRDVSLLITLGYCYPDNQSGGADPRIRWYQAAVTADPGNAAAYNNLSVGLREKGLVDEAMACCRRAIELDPGNSYAHNSLGSALAAKGRVDEAIASYRKALEFEPTNHLALQNLAQNLIETGGVGEALSYARKCVDLHPRWGQSHLVLGNAYAAREQWDEAIACYRKAIELDPTLAGAHHNLGVASLRTGRLDDTIRSYRRATELPPDRGAFHGDLALALQANGQHDAALASFRRAVELDPNHAVAHYNVGCYVQQKQRWDEAIASYRRTIEIAPDFAEAHCNLAMCLQNVGRFDEALQCHRRGHELGSKRPDWGYPSAEWVRTAEQRAAMHAKLPAFRAGEIQPVDNAERLEYATMCGVLGFDHAAARLLEEAFAADPRLADDLGAGHRYGAACCAARASVGGGEDASALDDRERGRLRRQALDWLRADLTLHAQRLETGASDDRSAVQQALGDWQENSHLAGVRDTAGLVLLPAEDRNAFLQLWADVAALLAKASSSATEGRGR